MDVANFRSVVHGISISSAHLTPSLSLRSSWGARRTSSPQFKFSSVQEGIYALEKVHKRPPRLSAVSPDLSLKRFQCSSD